MNNINKLKELINATSEENAKLLLVLELFQNLNMEEKEEIITHTTTKVEGNQRKNRTLANLSKEKVVKEIPIEERCSALTLKNEPCKGRKVKGKELCVVHAKIEEKNKE